MYRDYFHLARNPFEMSPDPQFFFATPQHREALAGLAYGITARKGVAVLTGEVGTGKSLVVRCLLDLLDKRRIAYAYVFNSLLAPKQFLQYIAEDLGFSTGPCPKSELLLRISRRLIENHRQGFTTVAIIDEAHHLDACVLEEVRLLTNLETPQGKLLQIALIGQPELDEKLESAELRQLKQRITLRFRLTALTSEETSRYIESRLQLAGAPSGALFMPAAITTVFSFSSGIPRLINTLCDNALLAAYALGRRQVSPDLVEEAAGDLHLTGSPAAAVAGTSAPSGPRHTQSPTIVAPSPAGEIVRIPARRRTPGLELATDSDLPPDATPTPEAKAGRYLMVVPSSPAREGASPALKPESETNAPVGTNFMRMKEFQATWGAESAPPTSDELGNAGAQPVALLAAVPSPSPETTGTPLVRRAPLSRRRFLWRNTRRRWVPAPQSTGNRKAAAIPVADGTTLASCEPSTAPQPSTVPAVAAAEVSLSEPETALVGNTTAPSDLQPTTPLGMPSSSAGEGGAVAMSDQEPTQTFPLSTARSPAPARCVWPAKSPIAREVAHESDF